MPTILIGIGKKKPGGVKATMPPPEMPSSARRPSAPRRPKAAVLDPDADNDGASDRAAGQLSPEEVCYSENDLCGSCKYMDGGNCSKYSIPVSDTGHCAAGYEPGAADGSDDAGSQSGMGDADDTQQIA